MDNNKEFPLRLVLFSVLLTISLLFIVTWNAYNTFTSIHTTITKDAKLRQSQADILLYDEILTMSASMAAATGKKSWIKRYEDHAPKLDKAIANALSLSDKQEVSHAIQSTQIANLALIEMEQQSFEELFKDNAETARAILSSKKYKLQKQIYAESMLKVVMAIDNETAEVKKHGHQQLLINFIANGIALILISIISIVALRGIKGWHLKNTYYEELLEKHASYDSLTDLPNRRLLIDHLEQAIAQVSRRDNCLAVLFIDLDDFKPINDTHGHNAGDVLLVELAKRMKDIIRKGDTISRIGGDEFVAVLTDVENINEVKELINRLQEVIRKPVLFNTYSLQVSASIGIALYSNSSDLGAEKLLHQADLAMYEAKKTGKNKYAFLETENHSQGCMDKR